MATNYTSLLGFALPTTGELTNTWGTVVNNSITELVEDSIAATATASVTAGDWTLSTTGSGATNEARCAVLIPTGTPGVARNVIAPSQSKAYIVINQSDSSITIKGAATTGVTITAGDKALVAWSGADFVRIGASAGGSNTQVQFNSSGNLAGSSNFTFNSGTGAVTATSFAGSGASLTSLDAGNISAGTLAIARGGTGNTTYTDGQLLIGNSSGNTLTKATLTQGSGVSITNGNGSITISATGSGGTLTSVGMTVPTFLSVSPGTITTTGTFAVTLSGTALPTTSGGTGLTGFTAGNNAIYSTSASALTAGTLPTAAGGTGLTGFTAANNAIYSTSASALTAGTLPTAAGGTGLTSFTSNRIFYASSSSVVAQSANLTFDGTILTADTITGKLKAYTEAVTTATVNTATYNIDTSLTNIFDLTLDASTTFTFTNPPASGTSRSVTVILRQGAGGSKTATFTNAKYSNGLAPVLSTTAGDIDVLTFFTVDGGSFWFGTFAMADVS